MSYDYLNKNKSNGSSAGGAKKTFDPGAAPDETMHTPPLVMFLLGGTLVIIGFAANGWQGVTTFTSFWQMFNPAGTPINYNAQPTIFVICGMIAAAAQIGLALMVWRIDTKWKKASFASSNNAEKAKNTAIEIAQHVDIIMVFALLGFIVDTIGDYTFIGSLTQHLDPGTQVFLIFLYAAFLYGLSTVVFVRGWEYLAAGWAASRNLAKEG